MNAAASQAPAPVVRSNKPDKMVTVVCATCRMALYMSDRTLHTSSWRCPSCGAITRTD